MLLKLFYQFSVRLLKLIHRFPFDSAEEREALRWGRRNRNNAREAAPSKFLNAWDNCKGSETTLFFSSSYRTSVYPYNHQLISNMNLSRKTKVKTHSKREILSEWMTFESIIGKNSSKIRVTSEKDSIHIPGFSLVPVPSFISPKKWVPRCENSPIGSRVKGGDRRYRRNFICIRFDSNSRVVLDWE